MGFEELSIGLGALDDQLGRVFNLKLILLTKFF